MPESPENLTTGRRSSGHKNYGKGKKKKCCGTEQLPVAFSDWGCMEEKESCNTETVSLFVFNVDTFKIRTLCSDQEMNFVG